MKSLRLALVVTGVVGFSSNFGCGDGGGTGGAGGGGRGDTGGRGGTGGGAGGRGGTGGGTAGAGGSTAGTGGGVAGTGGGSAGTGGTGGGVACVETNPPAATAAACQACIAGSPYPDGCCGLAATDPTGFVLCEAASACMRSGGTTGTTCNLAGDITNCLCGTHAHDCDIEGMANGPCLAEVTAAAARNVVTMTTDSPSAEQVIGRQGDTDYAYGRAANVHATAGAFCPTECGLPWPADSFRSRRF